VIEAIRTRCGRDLSNVLHSQKISLVEASAIVLNHIPNDQRVAA